MRCNTMTNLRKIEFFLAIDQSGDFYIDCDSASDAVTGLIDNYGGSEAIAVYALTATVPLPCPVPIECGTFPEAVNPIQSVVATEAAPE
jgi:hypothetical protein